MRLWWVSLLAASLAGQTFEVLDVQKVRVEGDPAQWVRTVQVDASAPRIACEILVAGAAPGGVAAALRAAERGHDVCLLEETDEIGGQLLSVSALDEHRFIERAGGTKLYQELRRRIRDGSRAAYAWKPEVARLTDFNPGACFVSELCFEPRFGREAIREMLAAHGDRIRLFPRTKVLDLEVRDGRIRSVTAYRLDRDEGVRFEPGWVLDATELGDLLPLSGVPYVAGSEAKADTGEPHAAAEPNPACVQSFTYPFILERRDGEDHRIPRPPDYEKFRDGQPFTMKFNYSKEYGWSGEIVYDMFGEAPPIPNNQSPGPFFTWRRVRASKQIAGENPPPDRALINWPRQDYHEESLLEKSPAEQARILQQAKRQAYAFLHWLQTDADGQGQPGLLLVKEAMESDDGLSKYPYIRESRRLVGETRVIEQDIVLEEQPGARARAFPDSVGTGFYMVDIHPCGANERGRMMMPRPFQIPMGTMLPKGVDNLLPAGKSLGVTHLTNGAYRLHPVEWNIGEAAATIASLGLAEGRRPAIGRVQRELAQAGVALVWFDDLPLDHPSFAAIQLAAIRGIYPLSEHDLHAAPEAMVTRAEAARALAKFFGQDVDGPAKGLLDVPADHPHARAVEIAVEKSWMLRDHRNWFHPDLPFYWSDWNGPEPPPMELERLGPVLRRELAERLTR
ncbi:MAG: FAD-dependent oxidoreductase [Acidobacteria bacterium]|nr:FAD-dependent oxidoreductase [Acidobacteriota bacterium]